MLSLDKQPHLAEFSCDCYIHSEADNLEQILLEDNITFKIPDVSNEEMDEIIDPQFITDQDSNDSIKNSTNDATKFIQIQDKSDFKVYEGIFEDKDEELKNFSFLKFQIQSDNHKETQQSIDLRNDIFCYKGRHFTSEVGELATRRDVILKTLLRSIRRYFWTLFR